MFLPLAIVAGILCYTYHGGDRCRIDVFDCLDGLVPVVSVTAKSDLFFGPSNAIFEPLLGGVPRGALGSELSFTALLFRYFNPLAAYILGETVLRLVGLVGMALLLRRHVLPGSGDLIVLGTALCFALLPYNAMFGLSIAGQPLLAYALLNLGGDDRSWIDWLIVLAFPFVSSLVLVGFFLVPLAGLYAVYRCVASRRLRVASIVATLLMALGYLVVEYRLVAQLAGTSGPVSHRAEFALVDLSLFQAIKVGARNFRAGQPHAASVQSPVVLASCLLAALCMLQIRRRLLDPVADGSENQDIRRMAYWMFAIVGVSGLISLWFGLCDWGGLNRAYDAMGLHALQQANISRLHYLHPLLWALAFGAALTLIIRRMPMGKIIVLVLLAAQCAAETRIDQSVRRRWSVTYGEFYSPRLFEEIRQSIGAPTSDYRVVSLGMHPAVALYNGFQTADGYCSSYPLEYKHRFRKVIAAELAKNDDLRGYFDGWGSRCYLFSSELRQDFVCTKYKGKEVQHLDIDTAALKDLDVRYILSAVKIGNCDALKLKLEHVFDRDDSPWRIHLYSLPR